MQVIEHLDRSQETLFSFEIIPPPRGKSVWDVINIVEQIAAIEPPFIDVTSHKAEAEYEELADGMIKRRVRRKRPGTISICGIIQNRYNIDTVPHLLCVGFTREETEDAIIELNYLGIQNLLVVRGDETNYRKRLEQGRTVNAHAEDLVKQVNDLKSAKYLDEIDNSSPINMCIGVGGYPEKHVESPNIKSDIKYLQRKVDAGADYIVTQMFYDNQDYFDFVDRCRAAGITVPIIPGLKLIDNTRQLMSLPKHFHLSMPEEFVDEIQENPKRVKEIGRDWMHKQCEELINANVPCIHFYVMSDARPVLEILEKLR